VQAVLELHLEPTAKLLDPNDAASQSMPTCSPIWRASSTVKLLRWVISLALSSLSGGRGLRRPSLTPCAVTARVVLMLLVAAALTSCVVCERARRLIKRGRRASSRVCVQRLLGAREKTLNEPGSADHAGPIARARWDHLTAPVDGAHALAEG
jgi:hypothetical protein